MTWLILAATLPTSPSGLRVRVWRQLRGLGCATLREGVQILPAHAPNAAAFRSIEQTIRDGGAEAHLLELDARDAAQDAAFRALFDRTAAYAEFGQALKLARQEVARQTDAGLRQTLRRLEQQLQAIDAIDHFPGQPATDARAGLATLRAEIERRLSPGEPAATDGFIPRLDIEACQGRIWATRARPWVDRLATAWLVLRCIDRAPTFRWLADVRRCPKAAIGYDFDGATFTHVGDRVTFEVVAASFGLDADPALRRLGQVVHAIDVGGIPADEAAGLATLVRGLQAQHADDDALLAAAVPLFDTLLAAFRAPS
ncbi:chromate resistance protein ChrB domain-containing protein [Leptothrix sp. BB-4]